MFAAPLREVSTSRLSFASLALTIVASVMLIGSVHPPTMLAVGALSGASMVLALLAARAPRPAFPAPALVLAVLAGYSALQALPLPSSVVAALSPQAYDIWAHALDPVGEPAPAWMPLSVDPGASLLEALKWSSYAAVFVAAAAMGARRGPSPVALVVFMASVLVALVTLAHGLLGVSKVFGIYEPRFGPSRWNVGPLLNPNNLVGYLNLGALVGAGLMSARNPVVPRWTLGLGIVFLIAVAIVSGSRGGMIALAVGVAVFWLLVRRVSTESSAGVAPRKLLVATLAATFAGGVGLAILAATDRTWLEMYDKNFHKLHLAQWARALITDFPWTGVGRGAFESVFPAYRMGEDDLIFTHVENFPVQWVVDWGIPVGVGGLLALAFLLRPSRLGAFEHPVVAGCYGAFVALLVHNLVDLGLEVPAIPIALAAILGGCWGAYRTELRSSPGGRPRAIAAGTCIAAALALAAGYGLQSVARERLDLSVEYQRADFSNPDQLRSLRERIRAAMQRHPAEPYFPRLGALVALKSRDGAALAWINRALERAIGSGRSHLVLARILALHGRRNQALLELRLAAEHDPGLAHSTATVALLLTRDYDALMRAVPAGERGANVLISLARLAEAPTDFELRVRCLREAVVRDPSKSRARLTLARALIDSLAGRTNAEACAAGQRQQCIDEVNVQARALERSSEAFEAAVMRARLRSALGDPGGAASSLAGECAKHASDKRLACLRVRAELAAAGSAADFDGAIKELIEAGCSPVGDCVETYEWAATVLSRKGDWASALGYYRRATKENPTSRNWAGVARSARKLGLTHEASVAEIKAQATAR